MGASRVRRRTVALFATLTLAGATLAGCSAGERRLEVGEVARVLDDPAVTRLADDPDLTVRLPVGELAVGWSDDADLLATVTDDEDRRLTAADDADLVAVAWDLDPTTTGIPAPMANATVGSGRHGLVLISGGEPTVLVAETERALRGTAVAAVADPGDLALEVTFDGVTQRVGPGPDEREIPPQAVPLHDGVPTAAADLDCVPEAFCRADAGWLPWVAGRGWAPEGTLWPVVRVEARADGPGRDGGSAGSLTATLDGTDPVAEQDLGADGGVNRLLVFPAAAPTPATLVTAFDVAGATYAGRAVLEPRR